LERGIKGFVVMSTDLEEVFQCIYDARVPSSWQKVCVVVITQTRRALRTSDIIIVVAFAFVVLD